MCVHYSYTTCRETSSGQIKWRPSWMLSWLPVKPPGFQMSILVKIRHQTSPTLPLGTVLTVRYTNPIHTVHNIATWLITCFITLFYHTRFNYNAMSKTGS